MYSMLQKASRTFAQMLQGLVNLKPVVVGVDEGGKGMGEAGNM